MSPSPSVAVITRSTEASASWSRETPSFSFRLPSTISNRSSSTVKVTLSPSSGSLPVTVPITAPAAFSATAEPVSTGCAGASFTSVTVIVTLRVAVSPSASVAVITRSIEASVS